MAHTVAQFDSIDSLLHDEPGGRIHSYERELSFVCDTTAEDGSFWVSSICISGYRHPDAKGKRPPGRIVGILGRIIGDRANHMRAIVINRNVRYLNDPGWNISATRNDLRFSSVISRRAHEFCQGDLDPFICPLTQDGVDRFRSRGVESTSDPPCTRRVLK